jgi:hypothetical protein
MLLNLVFFVFFGFFFFSDALISNNISFRVMSCYLLFKFDRPSKTIKYIDPSDNSFSCVIDFDSKILNMLIIYEDRIYES